MFSKYFFNSDEENHVVQLKEDGKNMTWEEYKLNKALFILSMFEFTSRRNY
jgi:hypothetical protein